MSESWGSLSAFPRAPLSCVTSNSLPLTFWSLELPVNLGNVSLYELILELFELLSPF